MSCATFEESRRRSRGENKDVNLSRSLSSSSSSFPLTSRSLHRPRVCKSRGHRLPAVREIDKFTEAISIVIATYVLSRDDARSRSIPPLWILFFAAAGGLLLWKRVETGSTPPCPLFSISSVSTVFLILERHVCTCCVYVEWRSLLLRR